MVQPEAVKSPCKCLQLDNVGIGVGSRPKPPVKRHWNSIAWCVASAVWVSDTKVSLGLQIHD